nr:hypothetical protein BaRGS_002064 [Batillaria attramentaria]
MALALSVSSGCPDYLHVSKQISQVSVKPFDETHISTDKNRRVFKQLCLKQQWGRDTALYLYSILLVQHETDLAFHVAYTQGVWDAVLQLYHSNGISNKSRKSALKRAIRQGAWNHVIQMTRDKLAQQLDACDVEMGEREVGDSVADQCDACEDVTRERDFYDSVTTQRDRRLAFVEAVRQGEWRWAMRLCENGLTVTYSDLKFALNTCVSLDHWKHIGQIRLFSDDPRHYWRMLNLTLKAIIEADNLPAYLQLCNEADGVDDMILKCRERGLENWVVQLAISLEKWGLVSSEIKTCTDQSVIDHTAKEAATAEEWTLVRSLLDRSVKVTFFSPMTRALQTGQLPLVRLLHESGSISNSELHLLKNDADITVQLERQRRQDIVQYVNQAASNPASLQHLCRLTVSHLLQWCSSQVMGGIHGGLGSWDKFYYA